MDMRRGEGGYGDENPSSMPLIFPLHRQSGAAREKLRGDVYYAPPQRTWDDIARQYEAILARLVQ